MKKQDCSITFPTQSEILSAIKESENWTIETLCKAFYGEENAKIVEPYFTEFVQNMALVGEKNGYLYLRTKEDAILACFKKHQFVDFVQVCMECDGLDAERTRNLCDRLVEQGMLIKHDLDPCRYAIK